MSTKKATIGLLISLVLSLFVGGCASSFRVGDKSPIYLKNNIHAQQGTSQEYRASYANWTDPGVGHVIIPVNTPVIVESVRRDLSIVTQDTKKTIYFEFDETRMGMSNTQYVSLITSPQPVNLNKVSAVDLKGIKEGKPYVGMTKEGVRIALGYPAVHTTPSLDSNAWTYWTNRFKYFKIEFDQNGKVSKIAR
jgi:hypothetical protein